MSSRYAIICYLRDAKNVSKVRELARALPDARIVCITLLPPSTSSEDLASELASAAANVEIRTLAEDFGSGAAYRAGFGGMTEDVVALLQLEGNVPPGAVREFFTEMDALPAVDALVGNRWSSPATVTTRRRRAVSWLFNAFAASLFALPVRDVQSPLKVVRRAMLERIFGELRLSTLGFEAELLSAILRAGGRIAEKELAWNSAGYEFPVVRTGLAVGASLLSLRILRSPLAKLPFVDLLGRRFMIPAKRSYDILVFCWRDPKNPLAGGGEVYLYEQARWWVRKGHRVTWFAQRFRGAPRRELLDGIQMVRGGRFPTVFLMGVLWYVFRSPKNYDFIIDCMNGIPFFTPLFSTKPKFCLVYHLHSHHFREELPWPASSLAIGLETRLVPLLYRNTPFLTISPSSQSEMERVGMSRRRIEIIESGIPSTLHPGPKAEAPTILYVGRLKAYKRVRDLIDAFVAIRNQIPEARLVVAGDGDDRLPLQAYAKERDDRGISFLGRVDEETKMLLMQQAWVFGMPSSIEGWGIVVIEANACGTPAVAYDVHGLRDCIEAGKTGLLSRDPAEFTANLLELLRDASLRERLSRNAVEWAKRFSWDRTAEVTLEQIRLAQPWRAVFEPDAEQGWRLHERASL